jgi:adenylate cyclase
MCATLGLSSLQTLICGPLRTAKGSILGWLTIANKKQGRYTEKDLVAFSVLASAASISLEHADHFQKNESERARLSSMMDIFQAVHDRSTHMSHHRLLFVMTDSLPKICEAHRCTCFVVDHSEKQELWSIQGDINIRMPIDVGIAGAVATSGEHIHIDDAYMDPRFNRQFDMDTGYRTKAVLAMPLFSSSGKVLAVLQFINKVGSKQTPCVLSVCKRAKFFVVRVPE